MPQIDRRTVVAASAGALVASAAVRAKAAGPMQIHMFAFRWAPGVTEDQKARSVTAIRALQGRVPGLLETWVGRNVSPRGMGFDLGGVMKFADKAALDAYPAHPDHQALLVWLVPLIEPIEIDFAT